MIHEFAIDPESLKSSPELLFVLGDFGADKGRMLSNYEQIDWKELKNNALTECSSISEQYRRSSFIDKIIRNKSLYHLNTSHTKQNIPILTTRDNTKANVLKPSHCRGHNQVWEVLREKLVNRTTKSLASCAEVLLKYSNEIHFIDAYFDPNETRYSDTLVCFMNVAMAGGNNQKEFFYHVKPRPKKNQKDEDWADDFKKNCAEKLPKILPNGSKITINVWKPDVNDFHARYIMTEIYALRYDHGLDQGDCRVKTPVTLPALEVYRDRWRTFSEKENSSYKIHSPAVVIEGKK